MMRRLHTAGPAARVAHVATHGFAVGIACAALPLVLALAVAAVAATPIVVIILAKTVRG